MRPAFSSSARARREVIGETRKSDAKPMFAGKQGARGVPAGEESVPKHQEDLMVLSNLARLHGRPRYGVDDLFDIT